MVQNYPTKSEPKFPHPMHGLTGCLDITANLNCNTSVLGRLRDLKYRFAVIPEAPSKSMHRMRTFSFRFCRIILNHTVTDLSIQIRPDPKSV